MDYFIFWRMYELFHRFYRYKFVGEIHLDKSRLSDQQSFILRKDWDCSSAQGYNPYWYRRAWQGG